MAGGRRRGLVAGIVFVALGPLAGPVQKAGAQEGGPVLTFGAAFRAETTANLALATPEEGRTSQIGTSLSFGLTDETRTDSLAFSASGFLRALDGPGADGRDTGLDAPSVRLSWRREGAKAALDVQAFLRQDDLDTLRGLAIDPETGAVNVLTGEGTQRQASGDIGYSFGTDGPWGLTLSAGLTDTSFRDAPAETDNRRTRAGVELRFALAPATEATLGLSGSTFKEDGAARRDTQRLEAGVTRTLARGDLSSLIFTEKTEDGTRSGLTLGRSVELPSGQLSYSLGLTRGASGRVDLTGGLDWAQELPGGQISLGLRRSVVAGEDDTETRATSLNASLTQQLSPLTALDFGLNAAEAVGTGTAVRTATLSATLSRSLARDWALDAGLTYRWRDEDGVGLARSNTVFLELRRNLAWRP